MEEKDQKEKEKVLRVVSLFLCFASIESGLTASGAVGIRKKNQQQQQGAPKKEKKCATAARVARTTCPL